LNTKVEPETYRLDGLKWVVIAAIVLAGVWANAQYGTVALFYRMLAGLAIAAVVALVALQTEAGNAAWNLAKEARVEIRKVVWPTRQETTQTTLIVVAVVFLVSLILWGLDSTLSVAVHSVIG